ncbi:MAG: MerR family transcriptional regulator, partial [Thermoanaerobaculia bacterium]
MTTDKRYTVGELAELGGVSRRTVRYYVQEGLIPTPLGVGRGAHYGPEHLEQLLRVKSMQERGLSLEEIRQEPLASGPAPRARQIARLVPRSQWVRLELLPGVELHISGDHRVPPPGKLEELV